MTIAGDTCLTCGVRNCSILKPCTVETLNSISTFKTYRKFAKGEMIFNTGDSVKGVYLVKKGIVKAERKAPNGRSFILKIAGRGDIFGHRGHDEHGFLNFSAVAVTDLTVCFIPRIFFKEILRESPDLEKQLTADYLSDLELMEQRSLGLAFKPVKSRVAEVILMLAEIYCYHDTGKPFSIDLTRQDFADLSGTTKEQVSAVLKDFERSSILKYSGKRFSFIDLASLKTIAET